MIYNIIESVVEHFPESDRKLLEQISSVKLYEKNEYILEQGKYCNHLWFINSGAVKAFESIDGAKRVTHFFFKNNFFTNYYCWVTPHTSDISFQAVQDCELIIIDQKKLMSLCEKHHIFDTIGRKIAENVYVQEFQLRKLLLNCNAIQRYEYLEQNNPEVFQHFPLKDIASFIGVTDVSLSRIRKERFKK